MAHSFNDKIADKSEYSEIRSNIVDPSEIVSTAMVSTYNSEKYFDGCIKDLVNQSLYREGKLEILVIDSNSQQGENAILREYESKFQNISYLRTVNREPLYKAWNRAIRASSGRYLTNANTDDRHHPKALSMLTEILEQNADCSLAYGDLIVTKSENQNYECSSVTKYIEYPDFNRIHQIHFGQCGPQPIWKKSLHQKYGEFCEGFPICADYEWWLRISRFEKFIHLHKLTGLYLESPTSIEHREPAKSQYETDTIRNFYAAVSNVKLDNQLYPNRAEQNFYSRYAAARDSELLLSIVYVADSLQALQLACKKLHSSVEQGRVEFIIVHSFQFDPAVELGFYSDRLRIRSVHLNSMPERDVSLVIGALHAGTICTGFLSDKIELDSHRILAINKRFSSESIQVLIVGEQSRSIESAFFRTEVFDLIRSANRIEDFMNFIKIIQNDCLQ